jgi:hypothetical protein
MYHSHLQNFCPRLTLYSHNHIEDIVSQENKQNKKQKEHTSRPSFVWYNRVGKACTHPTR